MVVIRYLFLLSFHLILPCLLCSYLSVLEHFFLHLFIIINVTKESTHLWSFLLLPLIIFLNPGAINQLQLLLWWKKFTWFSLFGRDYFQHHAFVQEFEEAGLKNFTWKVSKERFSTLVRMFYVKLNYIDVDLISEVNKAKI